MTITVEGLEELKPRPSRVSSRRSSASEPRGETEGLDTWFEICPPKHNGGSS